MKEPVVISVEPWEFTCGDGCCYNYGENLYVNDIEVYSGVDIDIDAILAVLKALGIEATIEDTFNTN